MLPLTIIVAAGLAEGLQVDARNAPPCIDGEVLEESLRKKLDAREGQVVLESRADWLSVALERPGSEPIVRKMRFQHADCSALQRTIELLLVSWWKRTAPAPNTPQRGPVRTVAPRTASRLVERDAAANEYPAVSASPRGELPAVVAPPVAAAAPVEPVDSAGALVPAPPPSGRAGAQTEQASDLRQPAQQSPWWASVALGGNATFDGAFTTSGRLALDAGLARGLGGIIDGGLESTRREPRAPGEVVASVAYLSLLARYRLGFPQLSWVFGVGARVFRIAASSTGYVDQRSLEVWAPAALASLELQWSPLDGFYVSVTGQAFARFREEQLVIEGLDVVARIRPFGATAGVGLGLRLK